MIKVMFLDNIIQLKKILGLIALLQLQLYILPI